MLRELIHSDGGSVGVGMEGDAEGAEGGDGEPRCCTRCRSRCDLVLQDRSLRYGIENVGEVVPQLIWGEDVAATSVASSVLHVDDEGTNAAVRPPSVDVRAGANALKLRRVVRAEDDLDGVPEARLVDEKRVP